MAELTQEIIDNAPEWDKRYSHALGVYLANYAGTIFHYEENKSSWESKLPSRISLKYWNEATPLPKINPVKESLPNFRCEPLPNIDAKKGEKYDQDKPRYDLVPVHAEAELVDVLTFGASKYQPNNWRKVPDAKERYTAAAMRHLAAYRMGETHDIESGKHHLAHAMCCLAFIVELDLEENQ